MKIVPILKQTLPVIASVGAGAVTGTVLSAFTPIDAKLRVRISFAVGAFVLPMVAGDLTAKYVDAEIDRTVEAVTSIKDTIDEIVTATKSNPEE